ncbi:hypothetical protein FIV42_02000 [Persicimonas caeni]|uniref:Uncharacterized protein n=1 Tax=Persicimonas caeni TaxID=2292766 RepID=A0A4Y6PMP6_PERCE|nr:hypothetical protein [Persicimonas caeni]QDG49552.1 hypothetical protein FIV42_02000 [Persicimonas caeni]QED30773.1 hypothetical protein FRD00_01995 [Persicimonas caeni]
MGEKKLRVKKAAGCASLLGLPAAALVMYIAWQHNPGGVFYGDDYVNWAHWSLYGVAYYLMVGGPVFVARLFFWRDEPEE